MLILLLALLSFGVYCSLKEGVVSVWWQGVRSHVLQWIANPESLEPGAGLSVEAFVDQATQWDPEDPQLLQTSGAVYWWGAWVSRANREQSLERGARSLAFYRRSLRRRPLWPEAWLFMAQVKHWLGEWDDEFQQAYEMAERYGGWRRELMFMIAELGFDAWRRLSAENRQRFHVVLARAVSRDSGRMQRMAQAKNANVILCLLVRDNASVRQYCAAKGFRMD